MTDVRDVATYLKGIEEATAQLRQWYSEHWPRTAIMTGTGLASIVDQLEVIKSIPYSEIIHFPTSTVQSHTGSLVLAKHEGESVVILAGRWHYYEGYSTKELTLPIRVLAALGVDTMLFTNVAGGVNPHYQAGDIIAIADHINTIPDNPLRGAHDERLGLRFPDMLHTYSAKLRQLLQEAASKYDLSIKEGIYYGLQGPSLETPAEYKMIHRLGADLVGMSTVPEVIVARHCKMEVAALSIVSNVCYPTARITETTIEEVIDIASAASAKLNEVLLHMLGLISTK